MPTTPYILNFVDLTKSGRWLLKRRQVHIAGGLSDCRQRELVSIGEAGPDKGKGGK
jgi:hypothetical protein